MLITSILPIVDYQITSGGFVVAPQYKDCYSYCIEVDYTTSIFIIFSYTTLEVLEIEVAKNDLTYIWIFDQVYYHDDSDNKIVIDNELAILTLIHNIVIGELHDNPN